MTSFRGRPIYFILGADGRTPEPATDIMAWHAWMGGMLEDGGGMPQVRATLVHDPVVGVIRVSTVFLGMDMGIVTFDQPDHRPVLFETMVFGKDRDSLGWRYCTWEEAEAGHEAAVAAQQPNRTPPWVCPLCGKGSHHPKDKEFRFCDACGFVDDVLIHRELEAGRKAKASG